MRKDVVYTILDYVKGKVDTAIVHLSNKNEFQVKFSENEIDTNKVWKFQEVEFFFEKDKKTVGSVLPIPDSENDLKKSLDNFIKSLSKLTPSPLYHDIYEGTPSYKQINESTYRDSKFDSISQDMPDIVNNAIDESKRHGALRNAGIFLYGENERHLVTSKGIDVKITNTYFEFNIRALDEGTDHTGTGNTAGSILSNQNSLNKITEVSKQAGETCKKMNNAKIGKSGVYDAIFSPYVSSDILSALPHQADPIAVLFGFSGLKDKIGEQLAPDFVTITDNPTKNNGMNFQLFDFEGCPTQETTVIEKGVFRNFIHNTSTAVLNESKTTGNSYLGSFMGNMRILATGFHGLDFYPGTATLDDLVEFSTKPVIYVQNDWYKRYTNTIEGIFSAIPRDGLFLIKNGEWHPIKKLRISDNLYNIMKNIQLVGKDTQCVKWWDEYGPEWFPSVRVGEVTFTSATK
jgi:PmbA protein